MSLEALATASMERYADEIKTIKPKFFVEKPIVIKKSYSNMNSHDISFIRRTQSDIGPSRYVYMCVYRCTYRCIVVCISVFTYKCI